MTDNAYKVTPRQAKAMITDAIYAGLVPFLQSSPGMGKSSIMRQISADMDLKLIDHRLSTSAPEDMSGLPRFDDNGRAYFAPFAELFPLEGDLLPGQKIVDGEATGETHQGWMLFLDEFNSAKKEVQAAAYKLILDRMTGQHNLHERVIIVAAGNLATDRAIVNPISTAMQSRVVHLEMYIHFDDWLQDVAIPEKYDSRIVAFLSQFPNKLMQFDPKSQDKTFACPRTWEFMNKLLKAGVEPSREKTALFAGTINADMAVEFVNYVKIFHHLPTVEQIVQDPLGTPVPHENNIKWATITTMMEKVNNTNFEHLCDYANRFDTTFKILFYRSVMIRQPNLRQHPAFSAAAIQLARYLMG